MIINCSNCHTSFNLSDSLVKESGTKVKCSKCQNIFIAFPPHPLKETKVEKTEIPPAPKEPSSRDDDFDFSDFDDSLAQKDSGNSEKTFSEEASSGQEPAYKSLQASEDSFSDDFDLSDLDDLFGEEEDDSEPFSEPTARPLSESKDAEGAGEIEQIDFSELENFSPHSKETGGEQNQFDSPQDYLLDESEITDFSEIESLFELDGEALRQKAHFETGEKSASNALSHNEETDTAETQNDLWEDPDFGELDLSDIDDFLRSEDEEINDEFPASEPDSDFQTDIGEKDLSGLSEKSDEIDFVDVNDLLVEDKEVSKEFENEDFEEVEAAKTDEDAAVEKMEEDDIEFDFDVEMENDEILERPNDAVDEEAGLDLDLEIDLRSDADQQMDEAEGETAEKDDPDLDFDLELDDGGATDQQEETTAGSVDSDLDFDLELDDGGATDQQEATAAGSVDSDLDFDLELDDDGAIDQKAAENIGEDAGSEIDHDLEMDLESVDENDDFSLDFDLDLEMETGEKIDGGNDSKKVSGMAASDDADGEISRIEAESDFDLSLEDDENFQEIDSGEEFDLSDLDEMVDLEEQSSTPQGKPDEDLELNFDFDFEEDASEDPSKEVTEDQGLEFEGLVDFSDGEDDALDKEEEFALDLSEKDSQEKGQTEDQEAPPREEGGEKIQKIFETITLTGAPEQEESLEDQDTAKPEKRKKGAGKSLLVILILALLGAGGYFGFDYIKETASKIPFLNELPFIKGSGELNRPDPGNLNIVAFDLDSKFVENKNAGSLFIITGKVKNEYPDARSFIRLSGKLYQPGKKLAQSMTVYAGNVISEMELESLELQAINERLKNRFGQNRLNVNVDPGKTVPFMIVFSDLPDRLEEYTVSVESSTAAKN